MQIFISYAPDDYDTALRLYNDLKKYHLKPWLDQEDLLPGQNWKNGIRQAIKESSYFLTLISSKSVSKRGFIQKEQRIALELIDELPPDTIFIIPVSVDGSKSAFERMTELQPVNLSPSYDKGLEKIMNFIRQKKSDKTKSGVNIGKDVAQSVIVSGDGNTINFSSSDHEPKNPSPRRSEGEKKNPATQDIPHGGWVLKVSVGSALAFLIALMIIAVFIPEPKPFQIFVFRVVLSLAAAGFGATIPGFLKVELPLWKKGLISATGAIALFVVVYKVNPPELIHQPLPPPIEMKQQLSGIVLDENGNPLSGVVVSLSDFGIAKTTDGQGAFLFNVEAEKQISVRLMAQKPGFKTWRQDATLGNTNLSFTMEKEKSP